MLLWLDDELVDESVARVSPLDHGLTVGDGVFETLKAYSGKVFAVDRHLDRLARSAAGMGLVSPPRAALAKAIESVVRANSVEDGTVRVTVTGGLGPLGSARGEAGPTVIVSCGPERRWPPAADVAVVPWPRNERGALAGLKTTSYGENVVALAWARERGSDEAVFANTAGNLCEGTSSNVFLVASGRLVTPPVSAGCLPGVTRDLVIELTGAAEEDTPIEALAGAEEAFLTSTTREVQPICSVDGRPIPLGPIATAARIALLEYIAR